MAVKIGMRIRTGRHLAAPREHVEGPWQYRSQGVATPEKLVADLREEVTYLRGVVGRLLDVATHYNLVDEERLAYVLAVRPEDIVLMDKT